VHDVLIAGGIATFDGGENGRARLAGRLLTWWRSRVGRKLLQEIVLMFGLFVLYKTVRLLARGQVAEASGNALDVIQLERRLGIFNETTFQAVVLHSRLIVRFFNTYYVSVHFVVMIVALVVLYVRHPEGYARSRRILLAMTSIAMVIYVAYPLAPPRMFAPLGFVDTGQLVGPGAYARGSVFSGVANQFAAMPSMHFGWAVLSAWAVIAYARSRYRYLLVLHPVLTLLAIVLTANHYWLDAIVAGFIFLFVLLAEQRLVHAFSHPRVAAGPTGARSTGAAPGPHALEFRRRAVEPAWELDEEGFREHPIAG
jgi:hypothetical protein